MVGEGVLLECLNHPNIKEVLIVNRKASYFSHPKLRECLIPDFLNLEEYNTVLTGYDACFFCAGISSVGVKEPEYTRITYDVTLHFASTLATLNPEMTFCYVSGAQTDSTEKGSMMWARVKGKTENDLKKLPFKAEYNFRPGLMKPTVGQQKLKPMYKIITLLYPLAKLLLPNSACLLSEVGLAMINSVVRGYPKNILEVKDIKELAKG